ncbi:uncharacterized protein LOC109718151 isoform X2 [Ananas comosus]|uniref:tRNA (guanine(46)-N(7))-methyltransferase n=1 Tax=Ananas comosus TaxID=4615 RepID=A0A6P5FVU7_ANACO|nr:uncharacterized protein LOC109718151 isoform X2 [Ananas comosus]
MANRIHPTQCYTLAWILRYSFGPTPYWKVALWKTDSKREGGNQWSTSMGYPVLSLSKPCPLLHLSMRIHRHRKSTTSLRRCSGGARSPDVVEREYADLNLKPMYGVSNMGHVRIRQHVNPLSSSFTEPVQVPEWKEVFRDSTLPLMVDIGCGSGRFLIWLAKNSVEPRNYLGLEIRQKCPDPHFKKRHHKRRVVQAPLVDSISKNLSLGGQVLLQSDVLEVASDMRDQFDAYSDVLEHVDHIDSNVLCDAEGWLLHNPMGTRTEREIHAELEGARIYRRMYQKTKQPS